MFYKVHNKTLDHISLTIWGYVNNCNTKYQGELYSGITRLCFVVSFGLGWFFFSLFLTRNASFFPVIWEEPFWHLTY